MILHAILLLWGSLAIADAAPCTEGLIKGAIPSEIKPTAGNGPNTVKSFKCSDPEKQLEHGDKLYASIECEEGSAWKGNGVDLADPSTDLHVKCVPKACHESLITGISATLQYKTKKLTCKADSLEYTEGVDKKLAGHLECDDGTNFWNLENGTPTALPADAPITVACVKKACHKSLITGYDPSRMDHPTDTLKCTKGGETLVKYTVGSDDKFTTSLKCDAATSLYWAADGVDTTVSAVAKITVACIKKACHESLVTVSDASVRNGLTLQCPAANEELDIGGQKFDKLTCDEVGGWMPEGGGAKVKDAEDKFNVQCVAKVIPCAFTPQTGVTSFDASTKTITCDPDTDGTPNAVEVSSTKYASISCNEITGWTSGEASTVTPALSCVKYCELAGFNINAGQGDVFTATCAGGPTEALFRGDTKVEADELKCTLKDNGWTDKNDNSVPANELKCRKACNNFKRKSATDPNVEENLKSDDIELKSDDNINFVIKCKVNDILTTINLLGKNAIQYDGQFVFSNIKCDAANGFKDSFGNDLQKDPYAAAPIDCVRSPCSSSKTQLTCQPSSKEVEYDCPSDHSPYSVIDDPNLLKCPENQIIFEATTKKFHKNSPQCKKEGTWQAHDDDKNADVVVNAEEVMCLRRRCNTCGSITPNTDVAPGPTPAMTDGAADKCAEAKCAKDLWYIKLAATTSNPTPTSEMYAGEVVCSSDQATESKWLTIEKKEIAEASCIPDATTIKCSEAAPLKFDCIRDYAGCDKPDQITTVADDADVVCPTPGKNMFYKQRGEHGFQEGAKKFNCDTANGVWTVTGDAPFVAVQLKRGGTVICADTNPQHTTTPHVEATTTPYVKPCVACPQFRDIMYTCATCSKKDSDVQIIDKQDEDKCLAQILDGKIETEKAGEVDKLVCDKNEKIWKTENGTEAGKFAAFQAAEQPSSAMTYIVAGSVGAVVFLIIVFAVIFKVFVAKKKPEDKEEETKRKTLLEEAKKKKKQKAGDNDEILDDVVVDSPSELKL